MEPTDDVLRGLLAAAPDALVAVDTGGRIIFVNEQAGRLFGWSRADLVGRPIECLVPERFVDVHPSLRAGYLTHPTTRPMGAGLKLWARRRDGSEFPSEISLSAFETASGTLVAAAIRDVSEARRTERRFRAVLASAPDAILAVDRSGRIELANAQAERLFGWSVDELVGKQVDDLVPDAVRGRHAALRASYQADPRSRPMGAGLRLSARRRDGSTFPAEISLSSVDEGVDSLLVLAAVRDITDRVELEDARRRQALDAQAERSHRLESLGQLAGGVAHDFNNLLGVILNYSTLILREVSDPRVVSDLGEIRAAAERAAGLTRQLLTFARQDTLHPEPLEVSEIVRGVASMLDRTLGEHVTLDLALADEPLVAIADRHHVEQIVLNLAINARDAMPGGGTLLITSERSRDVGDEIVLRVIDTGHGMPPEVLAHAFEPFFTTKPTGEGTGLGLATVYGIVGQNGGDVSIESTIGRGTSVTVRLPRVDDALPARRSAHGPSPGGKERILLVEDEAALRIGTARILSERGYEVLVASDGAEALEIFRSQRADHTPIDVVVSDVAMPKMRGDELERRLIKLEPSIRMIFLSGYDSADAPLIGRLLPKPVSETALLKAIREALDH
jgi:PAS domain S-box-containing protein